MKINEIKPQMRVAYIPSHNPEAKEYGTVSSVNEKYVFVRFNEQVAKFGWEGTTSQSCNSSDLIPA